MIDNSPIGVVDMLAARVEQTLGTSYWYLTEFSTSYRVPHVHRQFLPKRRSDDTSDEATDRMPFVHIFNPKGTIPNFRDKQVELEVALRFCGWDADDDAQGWRIAMSMLWAVVLDLTAQTILGAWQLIPELSYEVPYDPQPPYWEALLNTKWRSATVMVQTLTPRMPGVKDYGNIHSH